MTFMTVSALMKLAISMSAEIVWTFGHNYGIAKKNSKILYIHTYLLKMTNIN